MSKFGRTTARNPAGGYSRRWLKAFIGPKPGRSPGAAFVILPIFLKMKGASA